jgi:sec-independent protein translocase protein TatA
MGFSGIGIWEIVLIIVVALIVLGPGKIPEIARKLGQAVRAIRKASADLTTAVSREMNASEDKTEATSPKESDKTAPPQAEKPALKLGKDKPDKPQPPPTPRNPGEAPPTK